MTLNPSRAIAIGAVLVALLIGFFAGKLKSGSSSGKDAPHKPPADPAPLPRATSSRSTPETKQPRAADPATSNESQGLQGIRQHVRDRATGPLIKGVHKFEAGEFLTVWSILDQLPEDPFFEEVKGRALLRAAQLEDLSVILKAVSETHGKGGVRNSHFQMAFSFSKEPLDKLTATAAALDDKGERDAALRGITRNLSLISELSRVDMVSFVRDAPIDVSAVLRDGLGEYPTSRIMGLDDATFERRVIESLSTAKDLVAKGLVAEGFPHEIAGEMSANWPLRAWTFIERSFPELTSDPALAETFLNDMIRQNSTDALEFGTRLPNVSQEQLANAAKAGLTRDADKVERWYQENHAGLNASHASAIAEGAAEYFAKSGDAGSVNTWLNRIPDANYRQAVESKIEEIRQTHQAR